MQAQNITTVVGGGIHSRTSGTEFSTGFATAVAIDPTSGDLYFADATHGFVYSVNAHTGVPTLLETGFPSAEAGSSAVSSFSSGASSHSDGINGLTADGKGHLYIADLLAGFVYQVSTSGGTLQVVAGCGSIDNPACHGQANLSDGVAATSAFLTPASVAVDGSGNLLIADTGSCRIRKVTAGTISTVAGSNCTTSGGDGMAATLAGLANPQGVAVDGKGNIFIADTDNFTVREVCASSAGPCGGPNKIRTIAGGGANDPMKGGPATSASLHRPVAVSVDSNGILYVTENDSVFVGDDANGNIIEQLDSGDPLLTARVSLVNTSSSPITIAPPTPTLAGCSSPITPVVVLPGSIRTLAGNGQSGYMSIAPCQTSAPEGIPAMDTTLNGPSGVAVGGGLLLIADTANFRVRAVNLTGTPISPFGIQQKIPPYYVRTVVGNGQEESIANGSLARDLELGTPSAVVEDAALNIYITENPGRILKVRSAGDTVATIAGNGVVPLYGSVVGDGSLAVAAELPFSNSLFLDNLDDVLIAGGSVQGVNPSRQSRTIYGVTVGGGDIQDLGLFGFSVASNNAGNLYFNDSPTIIATNPPMVFGNFQGDNDPGYPTSATTLGDKGLAANAVFGEISNLCLDASGNVFVTDGYAFDVRLIAIGSQATVGAITVQPNHIDSIAGNGGKLPPSTKGYGYDRNFDHAYYTAEEIGDGGPATSAFVAPAACFVDNLGNIFLADVGNDRIRRVDRKTGIITTVAGGQYPGSSGDGGPAVDASLDYPNSLWGDQAGNLLISDSGNHRIREIRGILPVPKAKISSSQCSLTDPKPGSSVQVTLTNTGTAPLVLSSPPVLTNSKDFTMSTSGCKVGLPGLAPHASNAAGVPNSTCSVSVTPRGTTASTAVVFFDNALKSDASASRDVIVAPDPYNSGQAAGYVQAKPIFVHFRRH